MDEDILELLRMRLLQWKIHVEQLIEKLSFYLSSDFSLLAEILKANFWFDEQRPLQDLSEFGLESSGDGGVIGLVDDEPLLETTLLHELLSLVDVGRIQLIHHMPLPQLLHQSFPNSLVLTQHWIDFFQSLRESLIGIAFCLPRCFDLGGKILNRLLLDVSFMEVYVFIPQPADLPLGSASLPTRAIKRRRTCHIHFFPLPSQHLLVSYHLIRSRPMHIPHLKRVAAEGGFLQVTHGDGFGMGECGSGEDVGGQRGVAPGSGDDGRIGMAHADLHSVCQNLIDGHLFPASLLSNSLTLIAGGNSASPSRCPFTGFMKWIEADLDSKHIDAVHPQFGCRGQQLGDCGEYPHALCKCALFLLLGELLQEGYNLVESGLAVLEECRELECRLPFAHAIRIITPNEPFGEIHQPKYTGKLPLEFIGSTFDRYMEDNWVQPQQLIEGIIIDIYRTSSKKEQNKYLSGIISPGGAGGEGSVRWQGYAQSCKYWWLAGRVILRVFVTRTCIQLLSSKNAVMEGKAEKPAFGYIVSPGNNSTAIQTALKKRNVWQALSAEKELLSASFLWRQLNYSAKVYEDFEEVLKAYPNRHVLLNHFEMNHVITTKSGLLKTLKYYYSHELSLSDRNCYVHDVIPTSFYLHAHKDDTEYKDFVEKFHQIERKNFHKEKVPEKHLEKNVWFVKPESDNQGKGIILSNNFKEIEAFLVSKPVNSGWIAQKAIEKPLLYHGRKFDIRVWVLVTPAFQVYYYTTPYMRTSSSIYTTESLNSEIHLTNNCQQKHFTEYSKYQDGNTIPMKETLLQYIETLPDGAGRGQEIVEETILRMKEIIIDTLMSARKYFGKGSRKKEFQLFGYDFLIDEDYRTWLLEVNNNPYLGVPNAFIKELLPLMIDEMMELVIDPLFPPEGYIPVAEKRFQLIYKEASAFRISPVRVMSSSNDNKYIPKRDKSYSKQKSLAAERVIKSQVYNLKDEKSLKPVYSTPAESIRYLLDNYCFNDLDPFMVPVGLLLNSASLSEQALVEASIKKLKLVTQSRIAKILLEPKIYEQACNIIGQEKYSQRIKLQILTGFTNACKSFKAKIYVQKNLISLVCESLRSYKEEVEEAYLQGVIRLLIAAGGNFDRSIFIPGQSRQNEFVRELFIKSNSLKLLLYLKKKYPKACANELNAFVDNLSQRDWELFYEVSGNKAKRCYSPKVNTAPENEEETIIINANAIGDEKPRVLTLRQNAEIKNFRTRRLSGMAPLKKQ